MRCVIMWPLVLGGVCDSPGGYLCYRGGRALRGLVVRVYRLHISHLFLFGRRACRNHYLMTCSGRIGSLGRLSSSRHGTFVTSMTRTAHTVRGTFGPRGVGCNTCDSGLYRLRFRLTPGCISNPSCNNAFRVGPNGICLSRRRCTRLVRTIGTYLWSVNSCGRGTQKVPHTLYFC